MRRALAATAVVAALLAACPAATAATWTKPLDITEPGGYTIYLSDLAIDRHGDVATIGETYSKPDGLVVYSSHDHGPFEGEEVNQSGAEGPALCFDRAGRLYVLSHKVDFGNQVRVYTRPPGGSFGEAQIVDRRPGQPYGIAATPKGDVIAYWLGTDDTESSGGQVRVAIRRAGARTFGPVQDLGSPGEDAGAVTLLSDRRGNALLSWDAGGRLEYSIRRPGGAFGPAELLAEHSRGYRGYYDVAASPSGRAVAVWRAFSHKHAQVRAAFGTVAGGFGGSRRIGGHAKRGPYLAVDADGSALVAWLAGKYPSYEVRTAVARRAGSAFGTPHVLAEGYPYFISVASDGHGTATVAWIERGTLKAARTPAGRARFRVETVAADNPNFDSLTTTADGRTVLGWKARLKGRRARVAVADARHSFGRATTLAKWSRGDSGDGPWVAAGAGGGAFAWWQHYEEGRRDAIWFSGAYLLP